MTRPEPKSIADKIEVLSEIYADKLHELRTLFGDERCVIDSVDGHDEFAIVVTVPGGLRCEIVNGNGTTLALVREWPQTWIFTVMDADQILRELTTSDFGFGIWWLESKFTELDAKRSEGAASDEDS